LTPFNHAGLGDAVDWVGRLDEIHSPALIIHGTEDPVLPYSHGLALNSALRDSRLLTLEGRGHELHPMDWQTIIDAVVEHTAGTQTRSF
jgi:pimeloyl-ACP methyl ester carboxylesterase